MRRLGGGVEMGAVVMAHGMNTWVLALRAGGCVQCRASSLHGEVFGRVGRLQSLRLGSGGDAAPQNENLGEF